MRVFRTAAGQVLLGTALAASLAGCDRGDFLEGFSVDEDFRRDSFHQAEAEDVDILWVIDTSCSMTDEQEALAANFPSFIDFFVETRLPFHIGVTSTNVQEEDTEGLDGHLNGDPLWLSQESPDLEAAFFDRAFMGIDLHHGDERGLHASWRALEELGSAANSGFIRPEANLAVIVVSDEPDYCTIGEPDSDDFVCIDEYVEWLDAFKGSEPGASNRTQLSALVGIGEGGFDDPEGCNQPDDPEHQQFGEGALRGDGYLEVAERTGGSSQSICSDDWAELLGRLGLMTAGLEDTFKLSEAPSPGSLTVKVDGSTTLDWSYDPVLNAVVFENYSAIPQPGQEVVCEYWLPEED